MMHNHEYDRKVGRLTWLIVQKEGIWKDTYDTKMARNIL